MTTNPWLYNGEPVSQQDLESCYGFVYIITNTTNDRKYIGKKFLWHRKTKQVKGKKKRFLAESDWQEYYGSNKQLLEDVAALGPDKFKREILMFCSNKAECAYHELLEQINRNVLLRDDYYNAWIQVKIHSRGLKSLRCN